MSPIAEGGYTSCGREIKLAGPLDSARPYRVEGSARSGRRICTRRWSGLAEAHCAACHRHFSNVGTFDLHRVNGRCVDPKTIKYEDGKSKGKPRLRLADRASGPVWLWAEEKDFAAILAAGRRNALPTIRRG